MSTSAIISSAKHLLLPLTVTWLLLLCLFTGAMIAVHLIPTSTVSGNAAISVEQLYQIPQPPRLPVFPALLNHDQFTDRIILDMVRNADSSRPVEAAMMNYVPSNDFQFDNTKKIFGEGSSEDYARYWHGHQILARIALTFTTLRPLMIFNAVAGIILFAALYFAICRKISRKYALTFVVFILLSGFPLTMWSLQLTDIYLITFIAMLGILLAPRLTATSRNLSITFFTIGALTTFFDFLTFPLFTLCFPLVAVLLMRPYSGRPTAIIAVISWGLGYSMLWVSKWIIGSILTGSNLFLKAFEGVNQRMGELSSDSRPILFLLALTASMLVVSIIIGRRKRYRHDALLLVAALPILWFVALKNHSTVHFFFTWRTLLLTFYCITTYYLVNHVRKSKISDTDTMLQ